MFTNLARRIVPRGLRLALRHPVQSARDVWYRASARAGGAVRVRMRDDWEIVCHPAAAQAFAFERDQPSLAAELDGFVAACHDGMVLVDVGAHYGLFTLAALKWGGYHARAIALDPSEAALAIFDGNMRLAGAGTRVERLRAAAGAEEGETTLLTGGAGAWHMMVAAGEPRSDAVTVPLVTLDGLVARGGVTPTHVKIDVEGAEDAVLRGGEALLRRAHPIVFLELHGDILRRSSRSPLAVLERLAGYGYRTLEIAGRPVTAAEAAAPDVARIVCRA
jgi:FkbM family methyltransferase